MNQNQIMFSRELLVLSLLFWAGVTSSPFGAIASEIRQQRSDGCGPHPLLALAAASRPFGSGTASLNEILRVVKADADVWSAMQVMLRRYDDCIRAGDGLHYKRSTGLGSGNNPNPLGSFLLPVSFTAPASALDNPVPVFSAY